MTTFEKEIDIQWSIAGWKWIVPQYLLYICFVLRIKGINRADKIRDKTNADWVRAEFKHSQSRSQDGFLRSHRRRPVAACAHANWALSWKKGLAATTWGSVRASPLRRALNRPGESTLCQPSRPGCCLTWLMGTGSIGLSPRIRWPWWCYPGHCWHLFCLPGVLSSLLSLSRPSKSPHDRCWPLKARPRHRQWLIIDSVLGKIGTGRRGGAGWGLRGKYNTAGIYTCLGTLEQIGILRRKSFTILSMARQRRRGAPKPIWHINWEIMPTPLRAGVSDENWMPLRPIM